MKWFLLAVVMQGSLQSMTVNAITFESLEECKFFAKEQKQKIRDDINFMYPDLTSSTVMCVDKETLDRTFFNKQKKEAV